MSDEYEDDFDEYDEDFEEDSSDSDEDAINGNMENNKNNNTEVTENNNNIGDDIMMDVLEQVGEIDVFKIQSRKNSVNVSLIFW